jgi:hypothetical protein
MAGTAKAPQVVKLDVNIDKEIYDNFIRACSSKGFAPRIVLERLMKKYNETGQI